MEAAYELEETVERQPTSINELKPRMKLRGKVTKVGLAGAFVDIGLKQQGWIHISQLGKEPVNRVSDVLEEGDEG